MRTRTILLSQYVKGVRHPFAATIARAMVRHHGVYNVFTRSGLYLKIVAD